jgi:hypothetical protein
MRHKLSAYSVVMRGLDPCIHPPPEKGLFERWIAGSSPAMTICRVDRAQ